jgi:uncharacterized protein (TIGR00288 family)
MALVAHPLDAAPNLAVYCDFENVALGSREADYGDFDMSLVLERLLDKGQIIVKKAYADWDRFKGARRALHEVSFELIEIPHVSYSGKNSADIRLVVDALDLCFTKAHVDIFAVVTGDSDFSPLVGKLRENNKKVIGVGVKASTSKLLVECCDEFIYYDDLVRTKKKGSAKRQHKPKAASTEEQNRNEAMDLVVDTIEALLRDRDPPLWGSLVKQTLKRKQPHFSEGFYGYRNFSALLEDAKRRGLLKLERNDSAGGWIVLGLGPAVDE